MAEAGVLASVGWLVGPVITIAFSKACEHLGTDIDRRREKLEATGLPRLSLVIEEAEKSPNKEKLVDWLKRLKDAYYEAEEAIDLLEYEKLKRKVKNDRKTLKPECVLSKLKDRLSWKKNKLKICMDKLIEISEEANEFLDSLKVHENASGSDPDPRETISQPPVRVFGREMDKEEIVNLLKKKYFNSGPAIPIVIKNMIEIIVGLSMKKHLNSEPRPRSRPVIPIVIKNIIEIIAGVLMKKPSNSEPGSSTRPAIPTIAITGHSGVGKTSFARYVYKHMDGQNHFDIPVWVHSGRKFNASDVIQNMIEIIKKKERGNNDHPSGSIEARFTEIKSMLGSKKLLLVLDDFWYDTEDFVEEWKKFIGCLSSCSPGSRILLTTQSKNVAEKANLPGVTVEPYDLQEIEEDQILELFMHYAWPGNSHFQKEKFKKIGRKIAVKLKGDPGAAQLVGQHLSGKNLKDWEELAEKNWLGDNMKARIWSYQQLPLNLQRCFAICCLFPKGKSLKRDLLINLWMAEGFIRPRDKEERLEDIGENYLDELYRGFLLKSWSWKRQTLSTS